MWGRWPPRGVSGPPPPRPRERGDQRPPPDSPDASKHPEEARNSRMVPAKAAHWGKDWVKNPLQAVPKSSRAGNRPASGCASTLRSAGHRAKWKRMDERKKYGKSAALSPESLQNWPADRQKSFHGICFSRPGAPERMADYAPSVIRPKRSPTGGSSTGWTKKNGQEGRFIHDAHGTILTAAVIIPDIILYIVISILYMLIKQSKL